MIQSHDVAIIGGGHNGLVAACYLAKAGKKVILFEKNEEFGGATASIYAFDGVPAKLSRYSYLVSLFPDQIKRDLELEFETMSRSVSSYTPFEDRGVLINRTFDDESKASIDRFTETDSESAAWGEFYGRLAKLAERIAPTLLEPLRTEAEIRNLIGDEDWHDFVAQPLSKVLEKYFQNDLIKGIVLTDGLIGTFTSANDRLANICFLYHLIGNGTGEWRVPRGGMGKLVESLVNRAKSLGVEMRSTSEVTDVKIGEGSIELKTADGLEVAASLLIAACSPTTLERLTGISAPKYRDGCQIKMNMVLNRLPRLKSGTDPKKAFAGTFHIDESYSQLERAYEEASSGRIPEKIPAEMYCHTLTDDSILDDSLANSGAHTLTLFALHTPASLFEKNHDAVKKEVAHRILSGLNEYLKEPIEDLLLRDSGGKPCIEIKTPQELEREIDLPRGNIFHGDLQFPWKSADDDRKWGVETSLNRVFIAGAAAQRGGGVSGIGGHNAAMAALERFENQN